MAAGVQQPSGDPWLGELDVASRLASEVNALVEERNAVVSAQRDGSRIVATARRKLAMLGSKTDRLNSVLHNQDETKRLSAAEIKRREDLLLALRFKVRELSALLAPAQQQAAGRSALMGRDGASTPPPPVETERTVGRDNRGLVSLQHQMMQEQDDELAELETSVASTKHIALTINGELDLHQHLLDDLDADMNSTGARLQAMHRRMAAFTRQASNTCNLLLLMMLATGFVILALFVYVLLKIFV